MTVDEFEDGLDQFGPNLADWPEAQRTQAQRLLDSSAEARQALTLAVQLDGGLDALLSSPLAAPSGLADRIVHRAAAAPGGAEVLPFPLPARPALADRAQRPPRRFWYPDRSAMIAAAMLVVCFIGGVVTVQTVSPATADHESIYISAIYSDLAR